MGHGNKYICFLLWFSCIRVQINTHSDTSRFRLLKIERLLSKILFEALFKNNKITIIIFYSRPINTKQVTMLMGLFFAW